MNRSPISILIVCCVGALVPTIASAGATTATAVSVSSAVDTPDKISEISNQLRADDPAVVSEGVSAIQAILRANAQKALPIIRTNWLKRLMELQRYGDVLDLSLLTILASPSDTTAIEQLQSYRVQALLAEAKGPDALAAAKQLFDVCSLKGTAEAIRVVCQCLNTVHPDDREVLRRYRKEQIDGASSDGKVTDESPASAAPSTLSSISIDPSPYESAIRETTAEDFKSLTGQGNLLLLAGRAKEAWDVFERAYTMAPDKDLAAASENLARCMRAEDGTIGRANAWVLSIRPKAQMASERSTVSGFAATRANNKE